MTTFPRIRITKSLGYNIINKCDVHKILLIHLILEKS